MSKEELNESIHEAALEIAKAASLLDPTIVYNAIRTPDGTVLTSYHRHDYRGYTDKNGRYYAVDGGTSYLSRSYDVHDFVELSIYSNSPHEEIRDKFSWGSYGRNGDKELHHILLKDLTKPHIQAILDTQTHISLGVRKILVEELQYRKDRKHLPEKS